MKKIFLLLGIVGMSATMFISTDKSNNNSFLDIKSLVSINTANAENGSGTNTCYDDLAIGTSIQVYFCLDCRVKRAAYGMQPSKC